MEAQALHAAVIDAGNAMPDMIGVAERADISIVRCRHTRRKKSE